jgi:hypothetical protein
MRGPLLPLPLYLLIAVPAMAPAADSSRRALPPVPTAPVQTVNWVGAATAVAKPTQRLSALAPLVIVTTVADELDAISTNGSGVSLREALRDVDAGGIIRFSAAIFTSPSANTISLTLGELTMNKSYTIDASDLTASVSIQANGASRHFSVNPGQVVALKKLNLSGGNGISPAVAGQGGAIYNAGSLTLVNCRITGNTALTFGSGANGGGGIFCYPSVTSGTATNLVLQRCTVQGNTCQSNGGGIFNWANSGLSASVSVEDSTISGNQVINASVATGGGIMNYSSNGAASLAVRRSTIQGNLATAGAGIMQFANNAGAACHLELVNATISQNYTAGTGSANGVYTYRSTGTCGLAMTNAIIAGNIAPSWDDFYQVGTLVTSHGGNIIGINSDLVPLPTDHFGDDTPIPAGLAPLGDYGGSTQTMALLPGSIARQNGVPIGIVPLFDQRGFPVQGLPDAGSYESGNLQNYAGWIWEHLPASADAAEHSASLDFDSDGSTNQMEWLANTQPNNGSSRFTPTLADAPTGMTLSFLSAEGRTYTVLESDSLASGTWASTGQSAVGTGGILNFHINSNAKPRQFFIVDIAP